MRSLLFSCGLLACAEPRTIDTSDPPAWVLEVSVCGALPSTCTDEVWQTVCGAELVAVPYRVCATADGATTTLRYSAEPVESPCDLYGRIIDTWDALARGLSAAGCAD